MSVSSPVLGGKPNYGHLSECQLSDFLLQSLITKDPDLRSPGGVPGQ